VILAPVPWQRQPPASAKANLGGTGPIAVVRPYANVLRTQAVGWHEPIAFPNGTGVRTAGGVLGLGAGSAAASTNVFRLHSTANQTNTVWEKPSAQVSMVAVGVVSSNTGGLNRPIFGSMSPGTSPYTAWGLIHGDTNELRFETSAGGSFDRLSSPGTLTVGRPFVLVATYDGATKRLFIDGIEVASGAVSGALSYPNAADRGPAIGNFWNYTADTRSFLGDVYLAALFDRGLTPSEAAALRTPADAFALAYAPQKIWVPYASAGGDLTLNLSGQSVTSSSGSFTLNNAFSLSGQQASISAGTLAYVLSKALAGDSVTSSAGTLTQSHSNALSGQASTISAGTLIGDHSTGVSGQAVTISSGNLSAINSLAITGTAVTGSAGTLTHSRSLGLSGIEITVLAGTITYGAGGDLSIALTGQSLTASAGTLLTSRSFGLSGQGVTVALGNILGANSLGISGQSVTTSAGTFTLARTVVLDGEEVASLLGTITGDGVPTGVTIYYWQRTA
jgi:hypothetical protein